MDRMLLWC